MTNPDGSTAWYPENAGANLYNGWLYNAAAPARAVNVFKNANNPNSYFSQTGTVSLKLNGSKGSFHSGRFAFDVDGMDCTSDGDSNDGGNGAPIGA